MVSIDATFRAEEMLRGHRVELIRSESVLSRKNLDAIKIGRDSNGTPHSAIRARTTASRAEPVCKSHAEMDCPTMTGAINLIGI